MGAQPNVIDAIRTCNVTVGQWRRALAEGLNLDASMVQLLKTDLETVQEALRVISDWHSDAL